MLSAQRYVAYTSDIGESFRPIAHPYLVTGAYAVSWIYLTGDVAHEGYKAYLRNQRVLHPEKYQEGNAPETVAQSTGVAGVVQNITARVKESVAANVPVVPSGALAPGHVPAIEDYRAVMAQRAVFQAVASMGLPAFTIHSMQPRCSKSIFLHSETEHDIPLFPILFRSRLTLYSYLGIVRYSGRALKDAKNKNVRTWAPIGVRLFYILAQIY